MRFYTRRCEPNSVPVYDIEGYNAEDEQFDPEDPCPETENVSDRVEILDGNNTVLAFNVHENDAENVCAALNAADQDKLCQI